MRDHLATLLDDFRRYGRDVAVVRYKGVRRRTTTYAEIATMAGRFAAFLQQRGVVAGDRVVIWAENSAEWLAAFHGCSLRGVIAVPLDAYGNADFAARICADVKPKLAVGDTSLLKQLPPEWPRAAFEDWPTALPAEEAGPVAGLSRTTPLQILFTSGTTGDPKGIVHTHGNVLASAGPIADAARPYLKYERIIHPLRILHTLPLSHVFGQMMGLWVPPIFAAELHFENRLVAQRLIDTIHHERISVLAAVPRVLALVKSQLEMNIPGLAERAAAPRAKTPLGRWWRFRDVHSAVGHRFWALISGGGALPGPLEQFWNTAGFLLVQGYGMTETTALITLNHPFHVAQGSIGKPISGREVKLGPDGEVLVRGESISNATWSHGELKQRENEWLATGDLAELEPGGELKFLGRKSEVIVTGSGVNVHPEDLESVVEQEPGVAACAVVPIETPQGPEPFAVLAMRGGSTQAGAAIEHANAHLADFQRIRRWDVWPEPDLPRTSSGKVRRKAVAQWLASRGANGKPAAGGNGSAGNGAGGMATSAAGAAPKDWLLTLIAQITGEEPPGGDDEVRLEEDLHLDSLGRVQLNAAIEERLGTAPDETVLDQAQTLGDLRRILGHAESEDHTESTSTAPQASVPQASVAKAGNIEPSTEPSSDTTPKAAPQQPIADAPANPPLPANPPAAPAEPATIAARAKYVYPRWPWSLPFRWVRTAYYETLIRPLTWFLAAPRIVVRGDINLSEPALVIANHISSVDAALLKYALPARMRRNLTIAMSGEMLEDFRHFRNPEKPGGFLLQGPLYYYLVTALFNVFPLHSKRDFQRSFEHAGEALDRGMNVMVFPEGVRSPEGKIARFRPGIGLLVRQSDAPVLPMALIGLGELKINNRSWFRSGTIEIRVGRPLRFTPEDTETTITTRLQEAVEALMQS